MLSRNDSAGKQWKNKLKKVLREAINCFFLRRTNQINLFKCRKNAKTKGCEKNTNTTAYLLMIERNSEIT